MTPVFEQIYFQLWGEPPPPGYVAAARRAGLNAHEFELRERAKPAFSKQFKSQVAKEEAETFVGTLMSYLGKGV